MRLRNLFRSRLQQVPPGGGGSLRGAERCLGAMETTALTITAPGQVALGTVEVPSPGPGEALVRTLWSGISPGTELRCLAGRQAGAPAFPFIPGYALVGEVLEVGVGVELQPGQRVFSTGTRRASVARCWGGHCGLAVAPAEALVPVPAGVEPRAAAGAKLAAIAYHGVRQSQPQRGERVAVLGLGPIGRLSAHLHVLAGAQVAAFDLVASRRRAAAAAGLAVVEPAASLAEAFAAVFPGGVDIVVDATGAPPVLAPAAALLRERPWDDHDHPRGRLLVQGSYGSPPPLPYDELFLREATLLVPRDNQRPDLVAVLDLAASGALDLGAVMARAGPPSGAAAVYAALARGETDWITAAFDWSGNQQDFP